MADVIRKFKRLVNSVKVGYHSDKENDEHAKQKIKQIKESANDLSNYRDQIADFYADLVDFLRKLCDYDRKNFNIAAINRAMKDENGQKGKIDPRTKKDASSVSKSLYDEHVRMINVKSVKAIKKVTKDKKNGTIETSTVATILTKLNFRNYFDMNGKPSKELSYTYDNLRGMNPDVAVRKTVKLHAVCCIYMERMEQKIRLFFTGNKKYDQLRDYHNRMEKKLVKLTNDERRIIRGFSKDVYNELTGKNETKTLSTVKDNKQGRYDRIEFDDAYTSEFLRKIQEIKDFVGGSAAIIDERRYTRACFRSLNRLRNTYKGLDRRFESSFEVMAAGGNQKVSEQLKNQIEYPELIDKIDKKFEELERLYKQISENELALKMKLKKLDNKEKLRRYKNSIEKEFVLEKRGLKETDQDYEKRFMQVDKQRAKKCVDLIESFGSMQKVIEDYDLKFGRERRSLTSLLRELQALEDKPEFKNLVKESMGGLALGKGRTVQFRHNLNKKLEENSEAWTNADKKEASERGEEAKEILHEGDAEAAEEERLIQEEEAKEREAKRKKLEEEAKRKELEEEAKRKKLEEEAKREKDKDIPPPSSQPSSQPPTQRPASLPPTPPRPAAQRPADGIAPLSSQPPTLSTPSNEPIPRMHAPKSAPNLQGNASTDTYTGKPLPRDPLSPEVSVES